jgi:hypothetical protein
VAEVATVAAVTSKLPDFWVSDPEIGFFRAETMFHLAAIAAKATKID